MSGRFFRLVYFTPDPVFQTARFAVAALVETNEKACVVPAKRLPCADCAGGMASRRNLLAVIEHLTGRDAPFQILMMTVGPHFSLDQERSIPPDVDDPMKWVVDFVLPGGNTP